MCGEYVIGEITRTQRHLYWTYADFKAGKDYDRYRTLIEATRNNGGDEALDNIDKLDFSLEHYKTTVKNVRSLSHNRIKFTEGQWV